MQGMLETIYQLDFSPFLLALLTSREVVLALEPPKV
jgi:hypothetical protein